jgi:hypothetical protein
VKRNKRAAFGVVAATALIALTGTAAYAAVPTDTSELRDAVTADAIMDHLAELQKIADDNGDTRASGTAGYTESIDYVQSQLEAAGYEVTKQPFLFNSFRELSEPVFAQVSPDPTV